MLYIKALDRKGRSAKAVLSYVKNGALVEREVKLPPNQRTAWWPGWMAAYFDRGEWGTQGPALEIHYRFVDAAGQAVFSGTTAVIPWPLR